MTRLQNIPGYWLETLSAEKLQGNAAIISIGEENGDQPKLDRFTCPILKLKFSDVVDSLEGEGYKLTPLSLNQATEIIEFVEATEFKLILIHCTAGVSRSAGVVLGLNTLFKWDMPKDFWTNSDPNPQVVGQIIKAFRKREYEEERF